MSGSTERIRAAFGQGAWTGLFGGRIYRPVMRFMHRLGWCWPAVSPIEPGYVWCHWCGMRGQRPTTKPRPEGD